MRYQDPSNPTDSASSSPRPRSSPRWRRCSRSPTRPRSWSRCRSPSARAAWSARPSPTRRHRPEHHRRGQLGPLRGHRTGAAGRRRRRAVRLGGHGRERQHRSRRTRPRPRPPAPMPAPPSDPPHLTTSSPPRPRHPPASGATRKEPPTMLRSLFSGISGLRVNQTMLDVTGNNIANANTIGFKSSSTIFQDTLSQTHGRRHRPQRRRGPGRHQPDAGRPRRTARRDLDELQPGFGPGHRPVDRPDDPGRRHVRRAEGHRADLHPRRLLHLRRGRHPGHPDRRPGPGLPVRRRRQPDPARRPGPQPGQHRARDPGRRGDDVVQHRRRRQDHRHLRRRRAARARPDRDRQLRQPDGSGEGRRDRPSARPQLRRRRESGSPARTATAP